MSSTYVLRQVILEMTNSKTKNIGTFLIAFLPENEC